MKILQIIACIKGSVLGKRTRFQEIIKNSRFYHLVLTTPSWDANERSMIGEESGPNWKIKEMIGSKLLGKRAGFWLSWPLLRAQIFFEAIRNKVSLVHVHNPEGTSIAGGWAARLLGLPLIYEAHGIWATNKSLKNCTHDGIPRRLITRILRHEKWLVENATKVIVQTEIMAKKLSQIYNINKEDILVLRNLVDTNRFNPELYQDERKQIRRQWCICDDEVVFLYAGYLNWYNGINELLSVFEEMKDTKSIRLIIFGDGELREKVINSAARNKRINYFGSVSQREMPGIYAASDCVIMARPDCSEAQDATPMKLLEAMAMSRLVICSRVKGLLRICNEQTGLIIEPGDANELHKAIKYIAKNYSQLEPKRLQARKQILNLIKKENPSKLLDLLYKKIS